MSNFEDLLIFDFSAVRDGHPFLRFARAAAHRFDLSHHVHAVHHVAEHHVFIV